jgi:multidrug efflux pump
LITTAATVLGHLPLVLVSGPGAEARNSIGIILVTGMAIGTFFTLFILPHVYLALAKETLDVVPQKVSTDTALTT